MGEDIYLLSRRVVINEGRGGFCESGHKFLTVLKDKVKFKH